MPQAAHVVSGPFAPGLRARLRTAFVPALGILALLFSVVVLRALWSARAEWEDGQSALKDGRASVAITHFRRSASWAVPLSPYTSRALEMLAHLAKREAEKGRPEAARLATLAQTSAQRASRGAMAPLPSDPSPILSALALLGWLTWSLGSLALVTRGLDAQSSLTPAAPRIMALIVLGMLLFAVGLALA